MFFQFNAKNHMKQVLSTHLTDNKAEANSHGYIVCELN